MKAFKIFVLSLTFLIGGMLGSYAIDNLVTNPDFEEGTNGWTLNTGGNSAGLLKTEKGGVVGDCLFAQIDAVGPNAWNPEIHSPSFSVKAGKIYTCAFWAKTEQGKTRPLYVKFEQLDTWQGPGKTITITDEWTEYYLSPNMTVQSPPLVVIHIDFRMQKEDVWFDHFRVYQGEYEKEDIQLGGEGMAVRANGKLVTLWADIKSR
jgi:hypothetical protein